MADATALHVVPGDFSDPQRIANAINQYDALLKKGWRNVRLAKTGTYTVVNFDKTNTIALGGNAFYTLTFNAASGYDSDFVVNVLNEDTGRAKRISPNGIASFLLWPGQTCFVYNDNGTWVVNPLTQRWVFPSDQIFFIDNVNGNDNNDGLAAGSGAFQSFVPINKLVASLVDTNQKFLTISLAAGQSWSNLALQAPIFGGGTIILNGNNCTITGTGGFSAILCQTSVGGVFNNAAFLIENMTLTATGGGHGLFVASGTAIIFSGVTFGAITGGGGHIQADGNSSRILGGQNYTISGGANFHVAALGGGLIDFNTAFTITLTGTPAFVTAFAVALILGEIVSVGPTYSGAATGTRFQVSSNAVIYTNGAATTYFPGNITPTPPYPTGGQYA